MRGSKQTLYSITEVSAEGPLPVGKRRSSMSADS
jgi:hypothetical protein